MKLLARLSSLALLSWPMFASAAAQIEATVFKTDDGREVAAELGQFEVPVNRSRPDSGHYTLHFLRLKSTAKHPGAPIVYLAGGPGGSGIAAAAGPRFDVLMALREVADVIALDQRGTGRSNAAPACERAPDYGLAQPSTEANFFPAMQAMAKHCAAFWRAQGVDLDAFNTRENASDLVDLADALDVPKLQLLGISYGTHLALAAAKYHPQRIERLVLASAEGLDQTIKLPSRIDAMLQRLAARVAADPEAGERYPDLLASMRRVHARLAEQPVVVEARNPRSGEPMTVGIGLLDVQLLVSYLIKNPDSAVNLPAMYAAMEAGQFAPIAPYIAGMRMQMQRWQAMPMAMDAASGVSAARWQRVQDEAGSALLGRASNLPFPDINDALGVADLGDDFRRELHSDIPALFLSGDLDGRTISESHRELASGFAHGHFIEVENGGHDLLEAHAALPELIATFLRGKVLEVEHLQLPLPNVR